ncbi:MAG: heme exporter protein CcmB, partial [Acetobacter sp.]|nr:heme exporter protein CcmB [Acetobacter sp.]
LLSLPLITPALIFGAGSLDAAVAGLPWQANMELLGAFAAIALPLCPLAAGAGLRIAVE